MFPRLTDPILDAPLELSPHEKKLDDAYVRVIGRTSQPDAFREARFREGLRWAQVLELAGAARRGTRVIDVGAGNGAIEIALRSRGLRTVSVDSEWNPEVLELKRELGLPVERVIARAEELPFRSGSFGAALSLETIEHLDKPRESAAELARVLEPDAALLLTTPPRVRYLVRPDPHFAIRALLLLPAGMQRHVAARHGFAATHHYVDRIYWSVAQLARVFATFRVDRVLTRSRAPRRWFWDAIVFRRERN